MFQFYIQCIFVIFLCTSCGSPNKFRPCEPEPLPSFCVPERIRVALVLGSGGVRGTAHLGVLEVLEKEGINIDLIVGCSAGSIVGALYAENPHVEAIARPVWELRTESILDIDIWHCRYGLCDGKSFNRVLDCYLKSECFEDLEIPLVVVASDLHSGELVPMGSGDLVKAVQASCSIPFVFVPRQHLGRILVDGGVINPVPVKIARDLGAEIIIAVDLGELLTKTYPQNLFQVATRSAEIGLMWQNEVCTRAADVVIRPKTCGVGTFADEKKQLLYEAGKHAACEAIPAIKKLIAELPNNQEKSCDKKRVVTLDAYTPDIYMGEYPEESENEDDIIETLIDAW